MDPKISYLISTYDSASYLDRHLDDLLNRQYDPDFEVIIVDSDSPGADEAVSKKWMAQDSRVRYVRQQERTNYGVSWLDGWRLAKGEFVSNSNTDDLHYPGFTAIMHRAMVECGYRSDAVYGFYYAGLDIVDERGKLKARSVKPPFDFERYSYQCEGGPQLCWNNDESFRKELNWDLMYKRAAEHHSAFDYWLALYFMSLGFKGCSVSQILTVYTQRPDSIENRCYGGASTYESLASISEFFPHHFSGRLKMYKEFADFANLPNKEEWIANRKKRK